MEFQSIESSESSDDEREKAVAAILLCCALNMQKKKKRKKRVYWVKPWLTERDNKSLYTNLVKELILADRGDYRRFMRMNTETFEVRPNIFLFYCNVYR